MHKMNPLSLYVPETHHCAASDLYRDVLALVDIVAEIRRLEERLAKYDADKTPSTPRLIHKLKNNRAN